jgi:hypothetical protein
VSFYVRGCSERLLGLIDVLEKYPADRRSSTLKLVRVVSAREHSHTIAEGIDVKVNANDGMSGLIGITLVLAGSRYLPELPNSNRIGSHYE